MARRDVPVFIKEFEAAWDDKRDWEGLHREVYEFALPQRNPYSGGDSTTAQRGGQRKADRVFDSTLPNATMKLANRLQSELCTPGTKWAKMKAGQLLDAAIREQAQNDLANIEEALFAALHISNFDTAINEWFLELVGPGTAVMAVMEGQADSPVDFICVPQAQVAFREGVNGRIWGMYRKHSLMIALIEEQWTDAKVPGELKRMIDPNSGGDTTASVDLLEGLYYDPKLKTWHYDVVWQDGGSASSEGHRLVERSYKDGYWIVARWIKAAGETHGRGAAVSALPDAKTLNKLKELLLMNASLAVKGVWLVRHDAVINPNNVNIRPGAKIAVRTTGGQAGPAIARLEVGGDLHLAQLIITDLVASINAAMLNRNLPDESGPVRSPTELIMRMRELQMDLGSPLGRIITEGLIPMMQLALGVLGRAGIVPLAQDGRAIPLDGGRVKLELISPLVQQQNMADVEATTQWLTMQQSLLGKEVMLLSSKVEDIPQYWAEKMGVEPRLNRTAKERQNIQQLVGLALAQAQGAGAPTAAPNGQGGGIAPANSNGAVPAGMQMAA